MALVRSPPFLIEVQGEKPENEKVESHFWLTNAKSLKEQDGSQRIVSLETGVSELLRRCNSSCVVKLTDEAMELLIVAELALELVKERPMRPCRQVYRPGNWHGWGQRQAVRQ